MRRVYVYDGLSAFTPADLAAALPRVTAARRAKALSYVHASDRCQSVVAELLLRHALRHAFAVDPLPPMRCGAHGKPEFAGGLPAFNLSHCRLAVACAVADDGPVGIDVEPYASYSDEVARTVFSAPEQERALGSPERFAELWTTKESYLKFTGQGLTDSLPELLDDTGPARFTTWHAARPGYACTVCTSGPDPVPAPVYLDKSTLLNG